MARISVQSAAYVSKVLNNGPPAHPDTYNLWYLEPFPCPNGFGEIGISSLQKSIVFCAQRSFPTEACSSRYLLIPFQRENVNQKSEQVRVRLTSEGQKLARASYREWIDVQTEPHSYSQNRRLWRRS
jgi:hypothetical protein